jgi:acyl-coenzyme A thioesterase PaaI-like protein
MSTEHEQETWLRKAESGLVEIERQDLVFGASFLSGAGGPVVARYYRAADDSVVGKVFFGPRTEGAPGIAHGGAMAAFLDELMGIAVWSTGCLGFSTDLHVHFRKMLKIPQRYIGESRIERIEGRKVWTKGRLRAVDGATVYVEAEGLYVEMVDRATLIPPQLV